MRERNIKKQVWVNQEEASMLSQKSYEVGLTEAEFIRSLIMGYKPKQKPDAKFYEAIKVIRSISNNLNQIAMKAHALGYIDELKYKKEVDKLNEFMIQIKRTYLGMK